MCSHSDVKVLEAALQSHEEEVSVQMSGRPLTNRRFRNGWQIRTGTAAVVACGVAILFAVCSSGKVAARSAEPANQRISAGPPVVANANAGAQTDAACAGCHRAIYEQYEGTPMARASGPASQGMMEGGFTHGPSGVTYRIFRRNGAGWLSYARSAAQPGGYLNGELELQYFVGSNTRGRTYLYQRDGYWFETPVNWYAKKRVWDMAPNYLSAHETPLTLPVDANCLHCHATGVATALPGARNHFAGAPFSRGGVTCAACHGDATEHLRTEGQAAVLNPAKLDPVKRDSVCLQCHLEGETAVYRQGHSLAAYRPGDDLFESVSYFIHRNPPSGKTGGGQRATSQYEALLESKCKRVSGDRLTCTTCHDPHRSQSAESPAERVAFYRGKCLECHNGAAFATEHHPEQPDCANCHMPRGDSGDIAHEQVTDHRIQIVRPVLESATAGGVRIHELVPIGQETPGIREQGLAYAQLAQTGDRASAEMARTLLRKAEAMDAAVPDPALHTELGFLEQLAGDIRAADREYRAALEADPNDGAARGDLAILFARTGDYATAVKLWQRVFTADPAQSAAGYNLALGQCRLGQPEEARTTLKRLLTFSPDDQRARKLAATLAGGTQPCVAEPPRP